MKRTADAGNWQARGQEFAVGQSVRLVQGGMTDEGRVIAVWPGIGMVDVQWPHASYRHPVEDLQIINPGEDPFVAPMHEDTPGGPGSSSMVSQGAPQSNVIEHEEPRVELVQDVDTGVEAKMASEASPHRVAVAFVKRSLYWHAKDRKYRVSRDEHAQGQYRCPTRGCEHMLRRATYKMERGAAIKLLACPSCLFMIRERDVLADHCAPQQEAC